MTNGRFATALHILTLLAKQEPELLSSAYIAGSININPVLVRKEIRNLQNHGLILSKEGKNGGSTLAKPSTKILLSDIYQAVRPTTLLGRSNTPNPACPIGKQINTHIESLYSSAEEALIQQLGSQTLADFTNRFS
ncbi:MAG: transcriptional regulator [Adhaeribacter sp.]|jgi:Rrf2 family protein|nr:transcriptional regulator [Adhaeribacter sp.]